MLRALFRPAFTLTLSLTLSLALAPAATAATCGNSAVGFQAWKQDFASYARKKGVKQRGLAALAGAQYASRTIAADRNQKSFRYSLDKFMQIRGATTIVAQGRKRKHRMRRSLRRWKNVMACLPG